LVPVDRVSAASTCNGVEAFNDKIGHFAALYYRPIFKKSDLFVNFMLKIRGEKGKLAVAPQLCHCLL